MDHTSSMQKGQHRLKHRSLYSPHSRHYLVILVILVESVDPFPWPIPGGPTGYSTMRAVVVTLLREGRLGVPYPRQDLTMKRHARVLGSKRPVLPGNEA